MLSDDEIRRVGQAVQDGLELLFLAILEGSQVACQEFRKVALRLRALGQSIAAKGN